MTKMIDHLKQLVRGDVPPPPIAQLLGFDLTSVKPGEAVVEFEATEAHANPMGTLHGGVLCDIADAAMGIAYAANLGEGESFTTLELKINETDLESTLVCGSASDQTRSHRRSRRV